MTSLCVTEEKLTSIVLSRLNWIDVEGQPLLREAVNFFCALRNAQRQLRKPPGTAELLNWVTAQRQFGASAALPLREQVDQAVGTLSTLATFYRVVHDIFARAFPFDPTMVKQKIDAGAGRPKGHSFRYHPQIGG